MLKLKLQLCKKNETASKPKIRGISSNTEEKKAGIKQTAVKEKSADLSKISTKNSQIFSNAKNLNEYISEISSILEKIGSLLNQERIHKLLLF